MTKTNPDTVLLGAEDSARKRRNDAQANGAIDPGDLVERDSLQTGGAKDLFEVTAHSTSDEYTAPLVALEYAKTGRGIDDAYADGDHMEYWPAQTGDRLYMWVADGSSIATSGNANISVGDQLGSAGGETAGSLKKGVTAGNELFEALEAVDNSGASTKARIEVERI